MPLKLGDKKDEKRLTLRDFRAHPIWISPYGEYGGTARPVLSRDPDVTREVYDQCVFPDILCAAREVPGLLVVGSYHRKERYLSMLKFWQGGRWLDVKELKAPRPMTLVAVPKIEGKADVEFYLLTKYDLDAPRIGGTMHRFAGPDKFKHQKLGRGMIPQRIKGKPRPRASSAAKSEPKRQGPPRVAGGKFGPLKSPGQITVRDRIRHPVWVSTYEEDKADEDAQRAVISRDPNVSSDVLRKFLEATVTFRVTGADVYGLGQYERGNDALTELRFWTGKRWEPRKVPRGLATPLTLEPLCRILGKRNVRFVLQRASDRSASRVVPVGRPKPPHSKANAAAV